MKKTVFCVVLTLVMTLCLIPSAAAASDDAAEAAQTLYELGLFKGTGTNPDGTPVFDLDKTPTRNQAIIMLVRLLGKEEEAMAGTWSTPFTDVSDGMKPYIGYAYANGLTNGYTATTYNGTAPIRANQYITFVLRALGYESGKDFTVAEACGFSDRIGLTDGAYPAASGAFTRGDVAKISCRSLARTANAAGECLGEALGAKAVGAAAQPEEPFTETAFGDRALHEYLMSLGPDESILWNCGYFDHYLYKDRFMAEDLYRRVADFCDYVEVKEESVDLQNDALFGTRVSCVESETYGRNIQVETFAQDGTYYEKIFVIRRKG